MSELHPGRHFFLYAKLHYQHTDLLEDARKLVAAYSGSSVEFVSDSDVLDVVCMIALPYLKSPTPQEAFQGVLRRLISRTQSESRPPTVADVVWEMFAVLQNVRVYEGGKEVIFLGNSDPNILPLPED